MASATFKMSYTHPPDYYVHEFCFLSKIHAGLRIFPMVSDKLDVERKERHST